MPSSYQVRRALHWRPLPPPTFLPDPLIHRLISEIDQFQKGRKSSGQIRDTREYAPFDLLPRCPLQQDRRKLCVLRRMLALGLRGGRVMLVDEATGEVKWTVQAHIGDYSRAQVAMSPDGKFVASVASNDANWTFLDSAGAVPMVGAAHDGTRACICAVNDVGHTVLQERCPVVVPTGELGAVAFSPSG